MNPETLTAVAEIITAITLAAAAILPYTPRLGHSLTKHLNTLRHLEPTPRGRHRQGRARHTK